MVLVLFSSSSPHETDYYLDKGPSAPAKALLPRCPIGCVVTRNYIFIIIDINDTSFSGKYYILIIPQTAGWHSSTQDEHLAYQRTRHTQESVKSSPNIEFTIFKCETGFWFKYLIALLADTNQNIPK